MVWWILGKSSVHSETVHKENDCKAYLSYTELQTVLTEIEFILNSRPLGALYDDDMEEILTPNHLLYGRKLCTTNSKGRVAINQIDISKRAKHLETIIEHFWNRWRFKYLTSLQDHQKSFKRKGTKLVSKDDIVLIYEEKQPRQHRASARSNRKQGQ